MKQKHPHSWGWDLFRWNDDDDDDYSKNKKGRKDKTNIVINTTTSSINLETLDQVRNFLVVTPSSLPTPSLLRRKGWKPSPSRRQDCVCSSIRLSSKLFGNPTTNNTLLVVGNDSLSRVQRRQLFEKIGSEYCRKRKLHSLIIEGTTMGQVLPGELISLALRTSTESSLEEEHAIRPPPIDQEIHEGCFAGIRILEIHSGLVFNTISHDILDLAVALQGCRHTLKRLCLRNFLNHVRPTNTATIALLDPILQALSSLSYSSSQQHQTSNLASSSHESSGLEYLEISCLASMINWKRPLISNEVFGDFMKSCCFFLKHLELTNLGLEDSHITTLVSSSSHDSSSSSSHLQELIWNANENTIIGISTIIENMTPPVLIGSKEKDGISCQKNHPILCNLKGLSIINNVKLNQMVFDCLYNNVLKDQRYHRRSVVGQAGSAAALLQYFDCTLPLSQQDYYRSCIDPYLKIHRLPIQKYYIDFEENNNIASNASTPTSVEDCINKVIIPASKDNDITALYLLIRDKPTLCDVTKNGRRMLVAQQFQVEAKTTTKKARIIIFLFIVLLLLILLLRRYGNYHSFFGGVVSTSSSTTTTANTRTRHYDL